MPIDVGETACETTRSCPLRWGAALLGAAALLLLGTGALAGCSSDAASQQSGASQQPGAPQQSSASQPQDVQNGTRSPSAPPASAAADTAARDASRSDVGAARAAPDSIDAPEGMVYVPPGTTRIGITAKTWQRVQRMSDPVGRRTWGHAARPSFLADVEPFFLEKHPVTVAQFRQFTGATGYETQAESFGNAGVMQRGRWRLVEGADWQHPRGPSAPKAEDDHPVTQVSYNDAKAYCEWKNRRLPTEVEWEHAARGATNDRALCAGEACPRPDAQVSAGTARANVWQGRFPLRNTAADGFRYTAPVETFAETKLGLTGMSGNVWEWTSSWYRPYSERGTPFRPTKKSEKVQRGGSFQCNECGGYRVFARSHTTRETSLFHVGFRCAEDAQVAEDR